jgi:hypothetical protein
MRFLTKIQIICKLQANFTKPQDTMNKYLYTLCLSLFMSSCYDDEIKYNDRLPNGNIPVVEVNLRLNSGLNQPLGYKIIDGGLKGILVFAVNPNDNYYLAYELASPHLTLDACSEPMVFDPNDWHCVSQCGDDEVKYNIHSPTTEVDGITYAMRQYIAVSDGSKIVITSN